jgi:DNA polymerase-3 subunit delta
MAASSKLAPSTRSTPAPVYALIGEDAFLQLQRLTQILAALPADVQRVDIDGERAELAEVLDEARSFAMFGSSGGKVVVVRDADDFVSRFREQLENYVSEPSTSTTLILRLSSLPGTQRLHKAIAKLGGIEKCEPPKAQDVPRWITQHAAQAYKSAIAPDAAAMLADLIGADLGRLDMELAKLSVQAKGGRIGVEDVAGSVSFQREQKMWEMTNALGSGDAAEAVRRWRQLLQADATSEFRAVTWLTIWLENVRKALAMKKRGMNGFAICQQLRIWPGTLHEPFMRTVSSLGERGVARALDLLAEVDHQSKSGVGDAAANVERFLLSVNIGA